MCERARAGLLVSEGLGLVLCSRIDEYFMCLCVYVLECILTYTYCDLHELLKLE